MKRIMTFTGWLVMAATLIAGMTACSKENNSIDEPSTTDTPKTYTMTVEATKGDAVTRALTLEGKTLNATWTAGDKVTVLKLVTDLYTHQTYWQVFGQLTAEDVRDGGLTCSLTGEFEAGTIAVNDYLRLVFPAKDLTPGSGIYSMTYTPQDGKLATIANSFDYCSTSGQKSKAVTVTTVDGTNVTASDASFTNNQAIVCFTLKDADGDPIYPTSLTISAKDAYGADQIVTGEQITGINTSEGNGALTLSLDGTTNVVYAAVRGFSGKDVTLTATFGSTTYTYTKSSVSFDNGKYYAIGVKMTASRDKISLASLTNDYTAQSGDVLTGTLPGGIHLSIAAGASVTLKDVTINDALRAGITCLGNATINLIGANTVRANVVNYAGIQAGGSGKTLTIQGSGSLSVRGGQNSAGIGAGNNGTCGSIVINGGTITAKAGIYAAGIGSGRNGQFESITITDGITSLTAEATSDAAGTINMPDPIGKGNNDTGSGIVTIDGTTAWTAGATTTHLNWDVQSDFMDDSYNIATRWKLTHK